MNVSHRLLLLATLTGIACSNGPATTQDASTEGGVDAGKKDSGKEAGPIPDSGQDDVAAGPTIDPQCTVPAEAGSGGSCITLTGDGGIECNPITNAPCNSDAGEACDFTQTGFHCWPPPPPNTAALCAKCDVQQGPACMGTSTCVDTDAGTACARFCCDDSDCTPGHCDTTTFQSAPLGFCVK